MNFDTGLATKSIFQRRCPARSMCCPLHEKKICVKYIQPPRPESFKPVQRYQSPQSPLEGETIYHKSYRAVDSKDARSAAVVHRGNIDLPDAPLEDSTTSGLSYQWISEPPPLPFRPMAVYEKPTVPLREITTQRHDFPMKPILRVKQFRPEENINRIDCKMEDQSVTMKSYLEIEKQEPQQSFKPMTVYEPPSAPLAKETTTQCSYQTPGMPQRETFPWMLRDEYRPPDLPIDDNTTYGGSYLAPGMVQECSTSDLQQESNEICYCVFPKADEDL